MSAGVKAASGLALVMILPLASAMAMAKQVANPGSGWVVHTWTAWVAASCAGEADAVGNALARPLTARAPAARLAIMNFFFTSTPQRSFVTRATQSCPVAPGTR